MSHEECEYLNDLTRPARNRACLREWLVRMAIQWGGWLLAAMILMAHFAAAVH